MKISRVQVTRILVLFFTVMLTVNAAAATLNVIIITDPTGKDPNGAAAGSMSWDPNMFQSTFLYSPQHNFAVLSGGSDENESSRLGAIVETVKRLESNSTAPNAASAASLYTGIRVMCGGPTIGAAVGGDFDVYVVTVGGDGTITVTPYGNGSALAVLPPGTKGAIIHLRHSPGNPSGGDAAAIRRNTAVMIGQEIRDGHSATDIMGDVFKKVAIESGEDHGGGAVNLVSDISTADMFTPLQLNQTGFPMEQPYSKVDTNSGWSVAYPAAESYTTSPIDGSPLETVYAYDALRNAITVAPHNVTVYTYGTDTPGIQETTDEIVTYSVKKNGLSSTMIAKDINSAIDSGLLVGVNHVEPKDVNVKENSKEVGVYYHALPGHKTAPSWSLPISSSLLDIIGNMQTAIGLILIVLVLFRSTLISSFLRRKK